jgi:hypothetical protein
MTKTHALLVITVRTTSDQRRDANDWKCPYAEVRCRRFWQDPVSSRTLRALVTVASPHTFCFSFLFVTFVVFVDPHFCCWHHLEIGCVFGHFGGTCLHLQFGSELKGNVSFASVGYAAHSRTMPAPNKTLTLKSIHTYCYQSGKG